jgi:hypothetical protein
MARRLQANVRVAAAQIEERGPRYSRSAASSYSKSRSERPRQRRRSQGPLDPVAEEGRGENEVAQPVNPAANAAANTQSNLAVSYGPPWAHYLRGYQDRLLGGPLGLLGLCHTAPDGVGRKDYSGEVRG